MADETPKAEKLKTPYERLDDRLAADASRPEFLVLEIVDDLHKRVAKLEYDAAERQRDAQKPEHGTVGN